MQAIGYTGNLHFKEYPLEIPHESLHEYMTPITYYMIHVPRFMECMDKVNWIEMEMQSCISSSFQYDSIVANCFQERVE